MQVLHDVVEANPLFRPSPSTVKALLPVATDENWWARRDVARLCSNISGTNPSAKQFCRNLLSDWDADIMAAGALGLLRGGDYDPDLWLSLFGHTGFEIPETVEPGLSDFGKSIPDDALESLRTLLAASEFGHYQRAAEILSIVGRSSRKVIDALQSWLAAKQPRLQLQSASVLVKLGYASDSVSHTLRSLLDVDDPSVRLDAVFLLLDLEEAEDQVAQCALSLLETDDPDQLDGAFYILDETGHVDDGVLETLLSRLESKKLAVRKVAARPLLESGYRNQQLLDVLRSWLDDPDLNGRAFAANSLVHKGHVDEPVIQTLHVLVACEEYGLPMNAAEKLVNLVIHFTLVGGLGLGDNVSIGQGLTENQLFDESVEDLAYVAGLSTVEAKGEFIEVALQMHFTHLPLVRRYQPALEQRGNQVDLREFLGGYLRVSRCVGDPDGDSRLSSSPGNPSSRRYGPDCLTPHSRSQNPPDSVPMRRGHDADEFAPFCGPAVPPQPQPRLCPPALARERASPCRPSKSRRLRHFRPAVPDPAEPSPAATSATSARRSDSCPDRVHAANPWRSALFSECRPATWPETNSAAAPASCAGWFPPWERSGVGTRYRTSCLVGSSNPSWPSSSDKRTPLASGHRADTRSKLARW